eukprot:443583_1
MALRSQINHLCLLIVYFIATTRLLSLTDHTSDLDPLPIRVLNTIVMFGNSVQFCLSEAWLKHNHSDADKFTLLMNPFRFSVVRLMVVFCVSTFCTCSFARCCFFVIASSRCYFICCVQLHIDNQSKLYRSCNTKKIEQHHSDRLGLSCGHDSPVLFA